MKQPWRASPLGRHEKREADNGHDSVKYQIRKKRASVCCNCGGKGHPARLCPTPSDHAAHAVDEEGDIEEEWSDEGDVCGVECDCELNGTGDEDDNILGMGCAFAEQSKWERLAAVVDSGEAENVLPADVCNHVKLSATRRFDAGIGFRGAGGERIRNHGQRKFKVRMRDGHVAGTTWQVADVKKQFMSVAKIVAAGNRVHLDSKDARIVTPKEDVIPLRKAGNVRRRSLGQERCNRQEAGFSPAGLSPEVCPTDFGKTVRPVRNEGVARERNVVGLDFGGVEDAQEEHKVEPHAEEEPNMDCESDGKEDEERVGLLTKPRAPSRAEWERHVVSHMPFKD